MTDITGKICLVTGATGGIGRITAQELARMGATVIVVGRSESRGKAVVSEIRGASGSTNIELMLADLSSQAEVRKLADAFRQKYDKLDVLVNNAGMLFNTRRMSVDGIEMTFALNHLAYFLLTNLLLEPLKNANAARIINVSSAAHVMGKIDFDNLNSRGFYLGWAAYSNSKLANVLFTRELARRLSGTRITSNVVHPGFVRTGFALNNGLLTKLSFWLLRPFSLSPEQGAQTSIYLASSPQVEGVTGTYFEDCKPGRTSPASNDEAVARRLWEVSAQLTGLAADAPLPA